MVRCPGQDQRFWKPDDIFEVQCPSCHNFVEFFKDESKLKCRNCGQLVTNPKIDLGCAKWCQYAEQCLGVSTVKYTNFMREALIEQMKKIFTEDQKRIEHALAVLNYAEQLQSVEGGDPFIIRAAAILYDVGTQEKEQECSVPSRKVKETVGPRIAREILQRFDISVDTIEHICRIIANHHSDKNIDTTEFRVVWDADWLVNIPEDFKDASKESLKHLIDKVFKTREGYKIAVKSLLDPDKRPSEN